MSITGIPELREYHKKVGPLRFWSLMGCTFTWIGIGAWLAIYLNFPTAYGSTCHRKCLLEEFWFSPALVSEGHRNVTELALFAWLWSMPALVVGAFAYAFVTKTGIFKKN